MKTKIFLASSSELKEDRKEFEILIYRKTKHWVDRGVFLELVGWEDFLDALSKTRLQDEYNRAISDCDIFVMLFYTKVGKYTAEEFETAFGRFKVSNKPMVYTYFKDSQINTAAAAAIQDDLRTLWAFQKKLKNLGHFQTVYQNVDRLTSHFHEQLDKLAEKGIIKLSDGQTKTSERIDGLREAVAQLQYYCEVKILEEHGPDVGFDPEIDQALRENLDADNRILDLLKTQYKNGYANALDVLKQETVIAQVRATILTSYIPRSPLQYVQNLERIFKDAKSFLSLETATEIQELINRVEMAARREDDKSTTELYAGIRDKAKSCIGMLHRDGRVA
jgi:hypothetical protein